ncbi:ADC synthase, partial [Haematococcus lacustris]
MINGQQGLDELLASLDGSAGASQSLPPPPDASDHDGPLNSRGHSSSGGHMAEPAPTRPPSLSTAAGGGGGSSSSSSSHSNHSRVLAWGAGEGEGEGVAPRDPDAGGQGVPAAAQKLAKVVLARRSRVAVTGALDALWLLEALQERDPRAYQLYMGDATGRAFISCTPERLYARSGRFVASEAVAGTRPRGPAGDVERDFWLGLDLLRSGKDDREFRLVRDWIRDALAPCAQRVEVEVPKSVLKQRNMQHLYGRLAAELRPGVNDAQLLQALHPTPAVCGRPRDPALGWLQEAEGFDRGYYAGPFGWISGAGAEWAVAIRSALVHPPQPPSLTQQQQQQQQTRLVDLFAGVGVVSGSEPAAEWAELDLKVRPLLSLLQPGPALAQAVNLNMAWTSLLVEELCRQGVTMFCLAPGSRSSPLAAAVASHPRARLNVCIDERSLGFWAMGYGRATGRPAAVITSSGTAVANLLPAVVEASLSMVPLLLLTADRPAELRDTGANQTIDQVKIFGAFTRWFQDVPPPCPALPGRALLTAVSAALRWATASGGRGQGGAGPGPVHLNLQFREPLAPLAVAWQPGPLMAGLGRWLAPPFAPYTANILPSPSQSPPSP